MSGLEAYLPLVLIVLVGYLLFVRPAQRRARAAKDLQTSLSQGDEVMLTSGLFATVVDVQDEIARVELAPGIVVRVHRKAVGQIVRDLPPAPDEPGYGAPTQTEDGSGPTGASPGDENPGVN